MGFCLLVGAVVECEVRLVYWYFILRGFVFRDSCEVVLGIIFRIFLGEFF